MSSKFFILFFFLFLESCGDTTTFEEDSFEKKQVLASESEEVPEGATGVENSESDLNKIEDFPVLLDDIKFVKKYNARVYKKNSVISYLVKEKFVVENLLNKKYVLPELANISRSILITNLDKVIDRIILKFKFSQRLTTSHQKIKLKSVRLRVQRKRMLNDNFTSFGELDINFRDDYQREIRSPLFFNDQNFLIELPKKLESDGEDMYLITVVGVELKLNEESKWISLNEKTTDKNNCFFSFKENDFYISSRKINCLSFLESQKKVVLDESGSKVLSVDNVNNDFLRDSPSFKLKFNDLDSFGFYYVDLTKKIKNFFFTSFSYAELIDVLPYFLKSKLVLSEAIKNNIQLPKLSKINTRLRRVKKFPKFKKDRREILVRELGSRPGDAVYYHIPSDLITFESYGREEVTIKKSRSFFLGNKNIIKGSHLLKRNGAQITNNPYRLKRKEFYIGDNLHFQNHIILSSDFVRKEKKLFDNDVYEELLLETFLPRW